MWSGNGKKGRKERNIDSDKMKSHAETRGR